MDNEKSSVDRLNDTLNSRQSYTPPHDNRSQVHSMGTFSAPEKFDSPALDDMLLEHRESDGGSSKFKKFFIFSLLFFVAALGIAAYVYFGGGTFISTKNVDIQVTGPAAIEAGAPLALTITIQNKNNAELETANLSIQYPEGTREADNQTKALARDRVALGSVKAGGEMTHTFESALFGQKGDVKTLKLSLEYKLAGSAATFYKDKTFDIAIGNTPVSLDIDMPSNITSDIPFTSRITVASNSTDVLKNIVIRAEYPYGFSAIDSTPAAASKDNVWAIGDLAPGDKKTITLSGRLTGVDEDERTFRFYAGLADIGDPSNLKSPLVSTTETVHITRSPLGLSISMNGDNEGDYIAPLGNAVNAAIRYENNASVKLTNVRIVARFTGTALDKSSVRVSNGGFYDPNSGTITWQAPAVANLALVNPGEEGAVSVSFASLTNLPAGRSEEIALTANISGQPGGIASANPITAVSSKTVKITSSVSFSGKALYSRGPWINSGPLPPQAEATTTYTVVLDLANTQNDVKDAVATARLGPNVEFIQSSVDTLVYDQETRTLTWNVGMLESGTGFAKPVREAVLQVALKPSVGQIGTVPSLVSGITFSGIDTFTQLPVSANIPNITTRLTTDSRFVQGDETVVK